MVNDFTAKYPAPGELEVNSRNLTITFLGEGRTKNLPTDLRDKFNALENPGLER